MDLFILFKYYLKKINKRMETFFEISDYNDTTNNDSLFSNSTWHSREESNVADLVKLQINLNEQFNEKINGELNTVEFAFPGDRNKLQQHINAYFDRSRDVLGNYLDQLMVNPKYSSNSVGLNINQFDVEKQHVYSSVCWMKNWMEQAGSLKNVVIVYDEMHMDIEDFCHYEDVSDMN